jgi:hypothetical protein
MSTSRGWCLAVIGAALAVAAGCSAAPVSTSTGAPAGDRAAALHRAADCVRHHGIPGFTDPVVGADGQVFTDTRSLDNASDATKEAARRACQSLISAANWNPAVQAPAPPALVAAGARAAACLRQHGLPNMKDPTATTQYTPGHGFGMSADELPPGADKATPVVQQAMQACRALLDAEIDASSLDHLAGR